MRGPYVRVYDRCYGGRTPATGPHEGLGNAVTHADDSVEEVVRADVGCLYRKRR